MQAKLSQNLYFNFLEIDDLEDANGITPLNNVATLDILEYLVEKGAQNYSKCLVEENRTYYIKYFVKMGADVNATDKDGWTPLYAVAGSGKIEAVKLLLENGADVATKGHELMTPLHLVRNLEIAQNLIDHGAQVDERDSMGRTPLMCCVSIGKLDIAEYLISHGADIFAEDNAGLNVIHYAATPEIFNFLSEKGLKLKSVAEALHMLPNQGNTEMMDYLLEFHGGRINECNKDGKTIWISSATPMYQNFIGEFLVSKGADINGVDKNGQAALHHMCQTEQIFVDETLNFKEMGAKIEVKDLKGRTALHYAALNGNNIMVENLIWKKAEVNIKDNSKATPLHYAAATNKSSASWAIRLLLLNGADIKARDERGETPLHCACKAGFWSAVDLLLDHHADINLKDINGLTPLDQAKSNDHVEIIDLLRARGATEH